MLSGGDRENKEEANDNAHADLAIAVLATQPGGPCVAVAHDTELWLLDSRWPPYSLEVQDTVLAKKELSISIFTVPSL